MSARTPTSRKSSKYSPKTVHERSHLVLEDMLRKPSLSLSKAARKRKVDPRTVVGHLPGQFRKSSSGRIIARAVAPRQKTLYIPWFEPGEGQG